MDTPEDALKEFDKKTKGWGFLPKGVKGWVKTNYQPREYIKDFIIKVWEAAEKARYK